MACAGGCRSRRLWQAISHGESIPYIFSGVHKTIIVSPKLVIKSDKQGTDTPGTFRLATGLCGCT